MAKSCDTFSLEKNNLNILPDLEVSDFYGPFIKNYVKIYSTYPGRNQIFIATNNHENTKIEFLQFSSREYTCKSGQFRRNIRRNKW
ncbi:unnamed protein product [Cunninghamella blakesleeana]